MFSNFTETTSIRVNGIDPEREAATMPLLPGRMLEGAQGRARWSQRGEILIPVLLARGMKVKVGDTVVLVATNRDGSVNGKTFVVRGVLESVSGPGGRDGYIHIDDARELLRMKEPEVSEIAMRLKDPAQLDQRRGAQLDAGAGRGMTNQEGKPVLEVHTWAELSPFANIAQDDRPDDVFIKIMLVSIVLVSVMNVMIMAVYERIREIGTIAAIGTPPRRILSLFLAEGLLLGVVGTAIGTLVSLVVDLRAQRLEDAPSTSASSRTWCWRRRSASGEVADHRRDGGRRGGARQPAAGLEGLAHGPDRRRCAMSEHRSTHHEES